MEVSFVSWCEKMAKKDCNRQSKIMQDGIRTQEVSQWVSLYIGAFGKQDNTTLTVTDTPIDKQK